MGVSGMRLPDPTGITRDQGSRASDETRLDSTSFRIKELLLHGPRNESGGMLIPSRWRSGKGPSGSPPVPDPLISGDSEPIRACGASSIGCFLLVWHVIAAHHPFSRGKNWREPRLVRVRYACTGASFLKKPLLNSSNGCCFTVIFAVVLFARGFQCGEPASELLLLMLATGEDVPPGG
ncbi:hypothetical protein NL676_010141 [Syzygium grande]|nr:hypothetical protein NL676_010141 [Syzygium grande]